MKLPLGLEELKAVLNSPAERAFALFQSWCGRLTALPGSAGKGEYGPLMSFPAISGSEFNQFADALGHSHPRFTNAEPSEPDLFRALDTDTFILAFVDRETIEVTLWRAHETDYRTERGLDAPQILSVFGAPSAREAKDSFITPRSELHRSLIHPRNLNGSSKLPREVDGADGPHLSGEGFGTARSQPELLSSAA